MFNNRYAIERELGRGGMGVVYRAQDTMLGRTVAIKQVSASRLDTQGRERLLAEAQAAARLNHPNIITIYDAGEVDGQPFIIMELVEGHNLRDLGGATLRQKLNYLTQVSSALAAAHAAGIIHRDLKPENVLLSNSGSIKLMDFGLARSSEQPHLTSEGSIAGTVAYLAPELLLGDPPSIQSDLYALGVMLYELLTGQPPFKGGDMAQLFTQHLYATVAPPSTHNPEISPFLESLILSLLEKQPANRPASAAEVADLLHTAASERDSALRARPEPEGMLNRMVRGQFVARQAELAEALSAWQRAASGQGGLLLISGEPGIGKTSLVRELTVRVGLSRGAAVIGECYPERSVSNSPFAQMIPDLFNLLPDADLPDAVLAELVSLAPELALRYPVLPPNPAIDPQAAQQRAFDSVTLLVRKACAVRPLLLVIDDVHWADSSSLSMARYIFHRCVRQALPLLVVLTYRETDLAEARALNAALTEMSREPNIQRIKLSRMSKAQTRDLLAVIFAEEITPAFLDGIYKETEGNPFFVEEMCRALIDSGQLTRRNGRWHRPEMSEMHLPQNVRTTIESRLARLPDAAQDALRMASVLGREFDFDTLLHALEGDEDALIDALESAERAQVIQELRGHAQVSFSFTHALIPAALYEGISALRRQRMHRRALAALEAIHPGDFDRLAHHAAQGGDERKARSYYREAGLQALAVYAHREASEHLAQALELESAPLERAEIEILLGTALQGSGHIAESIQHLNNAYQLFRKAGQLDEAAGAVARIINNEWHGISLEAALRRIKEIQAEIEAWPDSPGLAAALHEFGRVYHFANQGAPARRLSERALEMARRLEQFPVQINALATLGILRDQTFEEQVAILQRAIELSDAHQVRGDPLARALNNMASTLSYGGRTFEAEPYTLRLLQLCRDSGYLPSLIWALSQVVSNYLLFCELDKVEPVLNEVEQLLLDAQTVRAEFQVILSRCAFLAMRGDLETALKASRAAFQRLQTEGDPQLLSLGIDCAYPLLLAGQWEECTRMAEICLTAAIESELNASVSDLAVLLCQAAALRTPRLKSWRADMVRWLAAAETAHQHQPGAYTGAGVETCAAWLAWGESRWTEAAAHMQAAIAFEKQIGRRFSHAMLLRSAAAALRQAGDPAAAALDDEATTLFRACGCAYWAANPGVTTPGLLS